MANPMVTSSMTYIGLGLHAFKYNYLAYVSGKPISIYYLVINAAVGLNVVCGFKFSIGLWA